MATPLADRSEAELKSAAEAFVTRVGQLGSVMTSFWKEVARNLISKGAMSATEFTVSDPAPSQIAQLRLRQKRMRLDWDLHSTEVAKYKDNDVEWWEDVGLGLVSDMAALSLGGGAPSPGTGGGTAWCAEQGRGQMLQNPEVPVLMQNAKWENLKAIAASGDWEACQAAFLPTQGSMADQSWERLATRAILFFSEVGHKTVGKQDSARTEMNQTLAIIARLRGEFLEALVTNDINPDSEFAPLIAEKLVKAAVSFVGEDPPGWAAIILKIMAVLEFQKPAQMERESVVVQRRTLGGALQVLNAIFGSSIGPAAHTRASSLIDQWSRKDQNFVQWAQIFGGTAEAGPQAFIEKIVIPKLNQWAGAYWKFLFMKGVDPGKLEAMFVKTELQKEAGYNAMKQQLELLQSHSGGQKAAASVLVTPVGKTERSQKETARLKKKGECDFCGEIGHVRETCWKANPALMVQRESLKQARRELNREWNGNGGGRGNGRGRGDGGRGRGRGGKRAKHQQQWQNDHDDWPQQEGYTDGYGHYYPSPGGGQQQQQQQRHAQISWADQAIRGNQWQGSTPQQQQQQQQQPLQLEDRRPQGNFQGGARGAGRGAVS